MSHPWVIVSPQGLEYIGLHDSEAHAWDIALGWPDSKEIADHKFCGWYAARAKVSWENSATAAPRPITSALSSSA